MLKRALSGAIYVAVIILGLLMGYPGVLCLVAIFALLGTMEFCFMTKDKDTPMNYPLVAVDSLCTLCLALGSLGFTLWLWVLFLILRFVTQLYITGENPLRGVALSVLAQLWIGLPLYCLSQIGLDEGNYRFVLAIFILIWLNDTGAYLVGSQIGQHRLFERLSPKKSWEGFFGGVFFVLVASVLFGIFCPAFFNFDKGVLAWVGAGVLTVVFSTLGDLFESMIKRTIGVKDSGNLIPGHGGILDRIDSMLFVMPIILLYILLV